MTTVRKAFNWWSKNPKYAIKSNHVKWIRINFVISYSVRVVFLNWIKLLRENLTWQFSISKYPWECLGFSIPCLTIWCCDVEFYVNLFNDITGCQIKITPHHRRNGITHKGCCSLTMIGLKYQHVACMLSHKTSSLEVSTWIFWYWGMKSLRHSFTPPSS